MERRRRKSFARNDLRRSAGCATAARKREGVARCADFNLQIAQEKAEATNQKQALRTSVAKKKFGGRRGHNG